MKFIPYFGPLFIDKECEFITFTAGQEDKLFTNVRDTEVQQDYEKHNPKQDRCCNLSEKYFLFRKVC